MAVELHPVGMKCQLACHYCYENPLREAGNHAPGYDLAAMKAALEAEGQRFTLFGGEPLLMPHDDLEELLRWGHQRYGGSSIQTNGALITVAHLDLFRRYNVGVGLSVDGPGELNDVRWAGTLEKTRAATTASLRAIDLLIGVGQVPSLIVTLHRGNATAERLPQLVTWLRALDQKGLTAARLHLLEVDDAQVQRDWTLTEDENVAALVLLRGLERQLTHLRFDLFADMTSLLRTAGSATCIWGGCDPLTTPAVRGVDAVGTRTNCNRTNKDGIDWVKADTGGGERYETLYQTPQADGGCQGCRFFFACKGQCPGTAIDGDWRNRSEQCRVWYRTFELIETELRLAGETPISWDPARRAAAEAAVLTAASAGSTAHGDHHDAPEGYEHSDNYFTIHGDGGMTRTHGDHGDA